MPDNPALVSLRSNTAATGTQRAGKVAALAQQAVQLAALRDQIAQRALHGDSAGVAAARAQLEQIARQRAQDAATLAQFDDAARNRVAQLIGQLDPCDADPQIPLLLLPVRLETRYSADRASLRVRIFPDDIHIDQVNLGITKDENAAGVAYWTAVWRSQDTNAGWSTFVGKVGRRRALAVARATRPSNLAQRQTEAAPAFPATTPLARSGAIARLLPDRFTVVAVQGADSSSNVGNPIVSAVPVALYADDGAELREWNGVKIPAGREWLVDYAEAERIGLAVTVKLKHPGARIDRLFVFGVRISLDPAAAGSEFGELLEAHRCGGGLAFVPQGTPTNNTETDRAAWQRTIEPIAPTRDPLPAPDGASNAAVLAAALGLAPTALAELDHAGEREQARAQSMNIGIWGPSWGSFLDKINKVGSKGAALSDDAREAARVLHRDAVRGRGPMPALRVGDQPYGVLPVSSLDKRWTPVEGTFERDLLGLLRRIRAKWRSCIGNVPQVGRGTDVDKMFGELLGSTAVSQGLRVRAVVAGPLAGLASQVTGGSDTDAFIQTTIEQMIWEDLIADASLIFPVGTLATKSLPLPLPLVDASDPDFIKATLAGQSPGVTSVLQVLLGLAWDRATQEVTRNSALGQLATVVGQTTALAPGDRERILAVAARAETVEPNVLAREAATVRQALAATSKPTLAEYQPVGAYRRSFAEMATDSTVAANRALFSGFALQAWLDARARLNELRAALNEIAATELQERRILLAESLDIASHRVDAWLTALVENRRRARRQAHPQGLSIGAYGWVENIEPTGQRDLDGGFIHAPSLTHAVTAGVLRSAYLSHNPDGDGDGALSFDLTSARVRESLHLVDGMRQAQPLGALLGYRIERALHEAHLDRFVLSLRKIAPRFQGKLSDRGETLQPDALEAITANNIVDGVALLQMYRSKPAEIRQKLDAPPADNSYLTGQWTPTTNPEWSKIQVIIADAGQALDSVSSLMLAESVHQMVQGNMARAAAALDAAGTGDAVAPHPQVVTTPSTGLPVSHSLLLVAAGTGAWNATRARATAEPGLEAWAAERLGDPATIVVAMSTQGAVTVGSAGLCALDVVYDAADRAGFERRLRAHLGTLPAATPFVESRAAGFAANQRAIGDVFQLASSLRALLVASRPATPFDLALVNATGPNQPPLRQITAAALSDARARAQHVHDVLTLRTATLGTLLTQSGVAAAALASAVEGLAEFGITAPSRGSDDLGALAALAFAEAHRRLTVAQDALSQAPTPQTVAAAGQALFGDGFWILPAITPNTSADGWDAALAAPPPGADVATVRTFVADLASVRDGVRRYSEAALLAEAVGHPAPLRVAQLAGPGKVPPGGWIGGELGANTPTPDSAICSYLLDVAGAYGPGQATVALVVDQWTELLPIREQRGSAGNAPIDARQTSGVAFNAAAPLSRAPQALLLAVAPDDQRWTTPSMIDLLEDTLDLAKIRAVTLERTNGAARVLPALYEQSWSLQGEKVLDLAATLAVAAKADAILQYVKEG